MEMYAFISLASVFSNLKLVSSQFGSFFFSFWIAYKFVCSAMLSKKLSGISFEKKSMGSRSTSKPENEQPVFSVKVITLSPPKQSNFQVGELDLDLESAVLFSLTSVTDLDLGLAVKRLNQMRCMGKKTIQYNVILLTYLRGLKQASVADMSIHKECDWLLEVAGPRI